MSKPIKPSEVVDTKAVSLPNEVIDSFNEMIAENWNGSSSTVRQTDVVNRIRRKMNLGENSIEIYANHWLDVEKIYEQEGWVVEYDKPGFNESYEPVFKFEKK